MCDIIGSLPLELLDQIVKYLDLEDIVRSQRVSKRWRAILSCDTIIRPLLRETLTFLGLDLEGVSTDVALADAMSYFQWRHNLQYARPIKKIFLPWPASFTSLPAKIQCRSRRLCCNMPKGGRAGMLNLETGEKSTWALSGKLTQIVDFLKLSDRYLVTGSLGLWGLHDMAAYDLHTKQKICQRIPPVGFLEAIVEDKVVFIASAGSQSRPLHVWDLSLNHMQKIGYFSNLVLYHVAATEKILVAFEINWEKRPPEMQQTKWKTTTGQQVAKGTFHLPELADHHNDGFKWRFDRCRTFGHKTVNHIFLPTDRYDTVRLEYDYAVGQLSAQRIRSVDPLYKGSLTICLAPNVICFWTWRSDHIAIYNATTGTVNLPAIQMRRGLSSWIRNKLQRRDGPRRFWDVFGDREVLGLADESGIELWFFSPRFVPDPQVLKRLKQNMAHI